MDAPLTKFIAVPALCLLLASCAQTGAPLPPSLELPKPPSDLRASRKGNVVTLTWSEPVQTTDRQSARYLGPTLVCRVAGSEMTSCGNQVALVPPPQSALQKPSRKPQQQSHPVPPTPESYSDVLPASVLSQDPNADLTYAIEVVNRNARGAGLSNRVHVPAILTVPAPSDVAATLTGDGVLLTWTRAGEPPVKAGVQYRYRIYRRMEPGETSGNESGQRSGTKKDKEAIAGEVPLQEAGRAHFLDAIEWENTYQYRVTAVTILSRPVSEVQIEGDDSPVVRVFAHDVFPPSVPAGLEASYSGEGQKPFIDLIWAPVTNGDLAGYNIYRSEGASTPIKVNSAVVNAPSYRDNAVVPGKTYVYSVSALDVRGNESARSEQASESVPTKE